jgi:hypothetical protein
MIRSGAVLVGCGLLALLGAILVHQGQGASWLIATSVGLTVAGTALLVVAPYPGTRRPLRVQLAPPADEDERAVLAAELLAALDATHADRADRG